MKNFGKQMDDLTFTDYYNRLMNLARTRFEWGSLPEGVEERHIEKFLFEKGRCIMWRDKNLGVIVTECTLVGKNNYGDPTQVRPTGIGIDETIVLTPGIDCVLIRNNDEMQDTSTTTRLFAYRLAQLSRTIDVNVHAQKTPVLITCSEKIRLSLKNIYDKWSGNEPVIFGDKQFDPNMLQVLKTDAPVTFPYLEVEKQTIWNEALTFYGINNANTEKRERLITDEVNANNVHIELSAQCDLKCRKQAAEEMVRLGFSTGTTVDMRGNQNQEKEDNTECTQDTQNTSET